MGAVFSEDGLWLHIAGIEIDVDVVFEGDGFKVFEFDHIFFDGVPHSVEVVVSVSQDFIAKPSFGAAGKCLVSAFNFEVHFIVIKVLADGLPVDGELVGSVESQDGGNVVGKAHV